MLHPIKHFITITKHRHLVIKYCFKVGIGFQGLFHDLSKYSFKEFWLGAKYYSGFYSPNENERKVKGYSSAWLHHKGRNKHHFEYWSEIEGQNYIPIEMPLKYLKESLCDRLAASKIYLRKNYRNDSPLEYFKQRNTKEVLAPMTGKILETWLTWISTLGENAALKKIKKIKSFQDMMEGEFNES